MFTISRKAPAARPSRWSARIDWTKLPASAGFFVSVAICAWVIIGAVRHVVVWMMG